MKYEILDLYILFWKLIYVKYGNSSSLNLRDLNRKPAFNIDFYRLKQEALLMIKNKLKRMQTKNIFQQFLCLKCDYN